MEDYCKRYSGLARLRVRSEFLCKVAWDMVTVLVIYVWLGFEVLRAEMYYITV